MELINRDTAPRRYTRKAPAVVVERARLRFNTEAAEVSKLYIGVFLHFYTDGGRWYFFVNTDDSGYKILRCGSGLTYVNSTHLCSRIIKEGGKGARVPRYAIRPTRTEMNGSPLFEIITEKRVRTYTRKTKQP